MSSEEISNELDLLAMWHLDSRWWRIFSPIISHSNLSAFVQKTRAWLYKEWILNFIPRINPYSVDKIGVFLNLIGQWANFIHWIWIYAPDTVIHPLYKVLGVECNECKWVYQTFTKPKEKFFHANCFVIEMSEKIQQIFYRDHNLWVKRQSENWSDNA